MSVMRDSSKGVDETSKESSFTVPNPLAEELVHGFAEKLNEGKHEEDYDVERIPTKSTVDICATVRDKCDDTFNNLSVNNLQEKSKVSRPKSLFSSARKSLMRTSKPQKQYTNIFPHPLVKSVDLDSPEGSVSSLGIVSNVKMMKGPFGSTPNAVALRRMRMAANRARSLASNSTYHCEVATANGSSATNSGMVTPGWQLNPDAFSYQKKVSLSNRTLYHRSVACQPFGGLQGTLQPRGPVKQMSLPATDDLPARFSGSMGRMAGISNSSLIGSGGDARRGSIICGGESFLRTPLGYGYLNACSCSPSRASCACPPFPSPASRSRSPVAKKQQLRSPQNDIYSLNQQQPPDAVAQKANSAQNLTFATGALPSCIHEEESPPKGSLPAEPDPDEIKVLPTSQRKTPSLRQMSLMRANTAANHHNNSLSRQSYHAPKLKRQVTICEDSISIHDTSFCQTPKHQLSLSSSSRHPSSIFAQSLASSNSVNNLFEDASSSTLSICRLAIQSSSAVAPPLGLNQAQAENAIGSSAFLYPTIVCRKSASACNDNSNNNKCDFNHRRQPQKRNTQVNVISNPQSDYGCMQHQLPFKVSTKVLIRADGCIEHRQISHEEAALSNGKPEEASLPNAKPKVASLYLPRQESSFTKEDIFR